MPLAEVTMVEGRTPEQIRALIDAVTTAIESSLGAPRESVRVLVRELPATHWGAGGTPIADRKA